MYHPPSSLQEHGADVRLLHGVPMANRDANPDAQYLIQDPDQEYGRSFIDHIYDKYGYRAICFYTDRRTRASRETEARRPATASIEAAYDFCETRSDDFINMIRSRHNVIAVVPLNATSGVLAADLAARLGLEWAQPIIMRRFRDKFALKHHLRRSPINARINASILVKNLQDVLSIRQQEPYRRFILKLNYGHGNRWTGLFDRNSPERQILRYFEKIKERSVVMEEYITGAEYCVNGQMDAEGSVTTVAIFQYFTRAANQRHNIDFEMTRVRHNTLVFRSLEQYSAKAMRASGLKRCPFHLVVKIDEQGPCLIEATAGLAGNGNAIVSGDLHGPRLSTIGLAAHYYVSKDDYGAVPLDWELYDAQSVRYVHGIADKRERVLDVNGVAEVECLPEFYSWVKKPVVGMRAERTVDALSMPWSLILISPDEIETISAAMKVRSLICWNTRPEPAQRLRLTLLFALTSVLRGLRLRQSVSVDTRTVRVAKTLGEHLDTSHGILMHTDTQWRQDVLDALRSETAFSAAQFGQLNVEDTQLMDPTVAESAHAVANIRAWRGYLPEVCVSTMIMDGWQWST